MEEKCVGVSNSNSVNNETHSQTSGESTSSTILCDLATLQPLNQPTTSRASSMSQLQEDDCSISNSQHEFAEVLDDETTTSGVLETFEISSSNSLPTSSDAPDAVLGVEDSSTADTIKRVSDTHVCESSNVASTFYNSSEVYIINDEDDENILANDVNDENTVDHITSEESANKSHVATVTIDRELNGVIMASDGSKIFLETPVVEEQLNYHPQMKNLGSEQTEYNEKAGRPKRLSDEFMLDENGEQTVTDQVASTNCAQAKICNIASVESMEVATSESTGMTKGTKSEIDATVSAETSHDRIMSVRLKKMSLTNTNACTQESSNSEAQPMPSSSQMAHQEPTMAEIESMDLIERRDFETEQRLTGANILKTSSILNKNMLNISLIKSCIQHQRNVSQNQPSSSNASNEEWPSSSNGRVVSSDSKCTYKDLSSTPTSSRKYNNRLTKSTAKINLCSALSQQQQPLPSLDQPKQTLKSVVDTSCSQSSKSSLASSVIVDPAASTSNANSSTSFSSSTISGAARTEVYNTNSNDNFATSAKSSCQQDNLQTIAQPSSTTSAAQLPVESGCSRTSAVQTFSGNPGFDDAQPSTSSARCHYAPPLRTLRQVNASAQTNERFISRSRLGSISGCVTNLSGRRARVDSSVQTHRNGLDDVILVDGDAVTDRGEFSADDSWADCDEENVCSDLEEICTCQSSAISGSSHGGSSTSLNETVEMDGGDAFAVDDTASADFALAASTAMPSIGSAQQRKRKYNEGRLLDNDYSMTVTSSGGSGGGDNNCRKRIAYDFTSTPRSSQTTSTNFSITASTTPTATFVCASSCVIAGSPLGRRTPRSLIPTRDNPPPELQQWLTQFQRWTHAERLVAVDRLIDHCDASQVRHMMKVIEPQFQRDFISLLPRELALSVLSYLEPKDLLRAAQTCRSWRFLCDDNLLWKEKCRKAQILTEPRSDRPKRGRAGNMPPIASPWKAAYMRQHIIEMNWRSRPVRDPKVLKGHDDHVITCLQFSGNRIVSGSDDNTLKVWSAVTGRCLRTLVGHTGGVWSSQMSGNIIISGSTDRTLKVWDMETGMCVHTLQGHTSTVRCMHLHGNKVVSGSRDATLRVWDIDQGSCLHVLVGHLAAVRCVQYDGKLIVSGAYDYMVKIWHPERQECLHTLQGHTNRVYSLQFDGLHVVSGSLDTSIRVWDVETGNCKHTLMGHQSLTSGMELRQNILVSGNADSTVKVWDITTGQCLQTLSGPNKHQSAVTCLQFNSRFVVTSSDDGTVKLWDVNTGEFIRNLVALESGGSGGVVWRIRANDTKLICAVGSRNGTEETKLMVLDFDVEGACVKCS